MDAIKKYRIIAFISVLLTISFLAYFRTGNESFETAMVVRVIDGDTIELDNGNRVRLLGINTPEKNTYYFNEASDALRSLVENKTVRLEMDKENNDMYGRLLRYVFLDKTFVNLELLENGYANTYVVEPNSKYKETFLEAEREANAKGLGLWKISGYSGCVNVADFVYKETNRNPAGEYVVFENVCDYDLDVSGWSVKDEARHVYIFKGILLEQGGTLALNSGKGKDNRTVVFWNSGSPIWNNNGDTLYLRDSSNGLVLTHAVGR